jgi:diadenosine tetraphosphatase ApaH/serine/threonine PP2A family protein phosphatase
VLIRFLSDVHGNLAALKSVLNHKTGAKADLTVCLGDIVGYGSHPGDCMNIIKAECQHSVAGNHDHGAAGLLSVDSFNHDGRVAMEWTRTQLESQQTQWLQSLPLQLIIHGLSMTHASPESPGSWIYIMNSVAAADAALAAGECLSIYGHTHIPMQWTRTGDCSCEPEGLLCEAAIINCGSVGQPRDGDPRAAYLLVDTDERTFTHVRVEYDIEAAAAAVRAAGLPEFLAGRLFLGK